MSLLLPLLLLLPVPRVCIEEIEVGIKLIMINKLVNNLLKRIKSSVKYQFKEFKTKK